MTLHGDAPEFQPIAVDPGEHFGDMVLISGLTLRHHGRLHHIGTGGTHTRTRILLLVQDLHIRVINAATGELLRDLTLDPSRDY